MRYSRKRHRNKGHPIWESPCLLDKRAPSKAFWGTHKKGFPMCQLKNAISYWYLQLYSSSLALSSTPWNVFTVLSDCYFPLSARLLSTVQSLLPHMLVSAPGPFQLSLWHPGSRSWQSLQSGSKCLPFLLFLSTSFKGSPQQLGLCPLCLLAFSCKTILSILTHHRFSAQDCRKMSLETNPRHEH